MRPRTRLLRRAVADLFPEISDVGAAIAAGLISVDGLVVTNPASQVRSDAQIRIVRVEPLRGEVKLQAAMDGFAVSASGRVALDVGASAGGFTRVLLAAGARRVYACDVGHGQLLGSLRQDPRVVNLEATNVAQLNGDLVPDAIGIVSIDVSYLALGAAVAQLNRVEIEAGADLLGLVKPMFELRRAEPPSDPTDLDAALATASVAITAAGWQVKAAMDSPVTGAGGAREMLVHAVWPGS